MGKPLAAAHSHWTLLFFSRQRVGVMLCWNYARGLCLSACVCIVSFSTRRRRAAEKQQASIHPYPKAVFKFNKLSPFTCVMNEIEPNWRSCRKKHIFIKSQMKSTMNTWPFVAMSNDVELLYAHECNQKLGRNNHNCSSRRIVIYLCSKKRALAACTLTLLVNYTLSI